MISQLRGTLLSKDASYSLIDVGGVGYEIATSLNTFANLPELNQDVNVYTHFVVREDAQLLYGFSSSQERAIFRVLIKINGIGPKVALAILSQLQLSEIIAAVNANDLLKFTSVPGIGTKTAQRLLIELADKIKDLHIDTHQDASSYATSSNNKQQEVTQALINLGYKPNQISAWLDTVDSDLSVEDMLKLVLQQIGQSR